jgi:hypothetical protein
MEKPYHKYPDLASHILLKIRLDGIGPKSLGKGENAEN